MKRYYTLIGIIINISKLQVLDTGTTVYINYDRSIFIEYNKLKGADIINNFRGGLTLYNNNIIRLLYLGDKGIQYFKVNNVIYVFNSGFNFISYAKL